MCVYQDLELLENAAPRDGEDDPDEAAAESLRLLGEAFQGQGQLVDALNFFDIAATKAPKTALIYISRGRCCLDMEKKGMRPPNSPEQPTKKEKVSARKPRSTISRFTCVRTN